MTYSIDWKFCEECENVVYRISDYVAMDKDGLNHPERLPWKKCQHSWRPNDPAGVIGNQKLELSFLSEAHKKLYDVRCYQSPLEMESLLNLLTYHKIETIVEIGSCHGGTANIWRMMYPQADIVCIDLNFNLWLPDIPVKRIVGDTTDERTKNLLRLHLDGKQIDFLFIDGDHNYESCKSDWEMYSPLVREGGIIAFHDVMVLQGVKDVFAEIQAKKKIRFESFQGIGVVIK